MIVEYKNKNGDSIYPLTSTDAVIDPSGDTLTSILSHQGHTFGTVQINYGLPEDLPRVDIVSELITANASTNTISPLTYSSSPWEAGEPVGSTDTEDVRLDFTSKSINFSDYIELNYQGKTSLADVKKGFGIDMSNKHKFGKWIASDSFHLKAFYEDFIKCRDWVCNQLMEQIYMSRKPSERRPFLKHNDFNSDCRSFFGGNALCHVDGFPVELYINGVYWGLYIWRLKKSRENYLFNKNDTNHVFLDSQDFFSNSGTFKWTGVEIRNPKKDSGNSSFPECEEPNAGPVKTIIETWRDFMWGMTSATTKAEIEEHMNMQEFIDVYLMLYVCNVWDSWARNTLYGTWDGQHFSPMPYDMNNSFNGFGGKTSGLYTAYYPPTSNTFNEKARNMPWFPILESKYNAEIKSRYKELKSIGIFTADNIVGLFDNFAMWCGSDAYIKEAERWTNCPSLIGTNRDIDSIANISAWVKARIDYIDSQLLN